MAYSKRIPDDLGPNPLYRALEAARKDSLIDLTQSNPTECGFKYPLNLLTGLSEPKNLQYEPAPLGLPEAREAVADHLRGKGLKVEASRLFLTSGTSEAYSFLFKLLGDPGDGFLAPVPGYPLLEHLARLEGVEALPYRLLPSPGWPLDRKSLLGALGPRVKGLFSVDPQNPMGCFLSREDRSLLEEACRGSGIPLILDEVFGDFADDRRPVREPDPGVLSVRLGGLSKSLGLPQLKLAWGLVEGPKKDVERFLEGLEFVSDAYLTLGTPVQRALPELLAFAPDFRAQVLERLKINRKCLREWLEGVPDLKLWPAEGGWYALLEMTGKRVEAPGMAEKLLEREGVLVQPGEFFGFEGMDLWVVSLLPEPQVFREGAGRMIRFLKGSG
jgi:aspartate/methionine/tyrosine aminotransferase